MIRFLVIFNREMSLKHGQRRGARPERVEHTERIEHDARNDAILCDNAYWIGATIPEEPPKNTNQAYWPNQRGYEVSGWPLAAASPVERT